jgi:hypothetical protein
MKRPILGTGVLLMCWIAAPAAQQTSAKQEEPPHKIYTLTGCLEEGTARSAFKLTGASAIGTPPPAGPSRTSAAAAASPDVYELQPVSSIGEQGISADGLRSHVGKRVEVTVRPVDLFPPTPSSSASRETQTKPDERPPQRYSVIKISRLAESCA